MEDGDGWTIHPPIHDRQPLLHKQLEEGGEGLGIPCSLSVVDQVLGNGDNL